MYRNAIAVFVLTCMTAANLPAQVEWSQTAGPEGISAVCAFTAASGTVLVGTLGGGVMRSTDNGSHWSYAGYGLDNDDVYEITGDGSNLYLGTSDDGVYMSSDDGRSWTHVTPGLQTGRASALLASGATLLFATSNQNLFRSSDAGATWTQLSSIPSGKALSCFLIDGTDILAGGNTGAFLRSSDDGLTWNTINAGHTATINVLAQLPDGRIAMGTNSGVFTSMDRTTWTPMSAGLPTASINTMLVDDQDDPYAGLSNAGIYRWSQATSQWENAGTEFDEDWIIALTDLGGADVLLAASSHELMRWNSAARQWQRAMTGLIAPRVYTLALDPAGAIYTGAASGKMEKSTDGGLSWTRMFEGYTRQIVNGIVPVDAHSIFLGTQGDGIFGSSDGGSSWSEMNSGLGNSTVYALGRSHTTTLYAGTRAGLYLSRDDAQSWTRSAGDKPYNVATLAFHGNEILAGADSGRVLRSTDDGTSWQVATIGSGNRVYALIRAPFGDLYAAVWSEGLYHSTDDGANWQMIGQNVSEAASPGDLLHAGNTLYFSTYGGGIWSSTDRGTNWTQINQGLLIDRVPALLLGHDGYLYASTQGAGVFKSTQRIVTSVREAAAAPSGIRLHDSWPVPSANVVKIRFSCAGSGTVTVDVFDALGRRQLQHVAETAIGMQTMSLDLSSLPDGVYTYRFATSTSVTGGRLLVVH